MEPNGLVFETLQGQQSGREQRRPSEESLQLYAQVYRLHPAVSSGLPLRAHVDRNPSNQVSDGGLLGGTACCDQGGYSGSRRQSTKAAAVTTTSPSSNATHGGRTGFLGQIVLWKPQRTTALNFSFSVGYLVQRVNVPLLRLLHQLSSL